MYPENKFLLSTSSKEFKETIMLVCVCALLHCNICYHLHISETVTQPGNESNAVKLSGSHEKPNDAVVHVSLA